MPAQSVQGRHAQCGTADKGAVVQVEAVNQQLFQLDCTQPAQELLVAAQLHAGVGGISAAMQQVLLRGQPCFDADFQAAPPRRS